MSMCPRLAPSHWRAPVACVSWDTRCGRADTTRAISQWWIEAAEVSPRSLEDQPAVAARAIHQRAGGSTGGARRLQSLGGGEGHRRQPLAREVRLPTAAHQLRQTLQRGLLDQEVRARAST